MGCSSRTNEQGTTSKKQPESQVAKIAFKGSLKVLTLNAWHEGTKVSDGFNAIAKVIHRSEADIVMLCEITNHNNVVFSDRIVKELMDRGEKYYSFNSGKSPIILSKFPIVSTPALNTSYLTKCRVQIDENLQIAIYSAHLDYTHYACYLPRGYDGITWKKLPEPILDTKIILEQNKASQRDEAIALFVNNAQEETENGNIVLLGGDFNEPSHLDWGEASKDLFDHNGTVVPWQNSKTLAEKGFLDTYRTKYPDPVTHPGFTWLANNTHVPLDELVWTPEADDRDRIDFIYYRPHERLALEDAVVVGPVGCVVNGERVVINPGQDKFLEMNGIWPSDHKGVLATFRID